MCRNNEPKRPEVNVAEVSDSPSRHGGIAWILVVGAALHWASMAFALIPAVATSELTVVRPAGLTWLCTVLSVPVCLVAVLGARWFEWQGFRRALAVVSMFGSLLALAAVFFPHSNDELAGYAVSAVYQVAQTAAICPLVLLWGLAFASLNKRTAAGHVVLTSAFTSTLLMTFLFLYSELPVCGPLLESCPRFLSSLLLLTSHVRFVVKERSFQRCQERSFVRFLGARALIGLAIGWLGSTVVGVGVSPTTSLLGSVVAAAAVVALIWRREFLFRLAPLAPLLFAGAFALPFFGIDTEFLVPSCLASTAALCWTCWIVVSSFQISGLKETFGMGEARLCFAEKTVLLAGWVVGMVIARQGLLPEAVTSDVTLCSSIVALVGYLVVIWATYASFRTVYSRREDELIDRLEATREERREHVYDTIGERSGLTKRETEVMRMLAQGFTRPYICQELGISDGTARAHASHVYQKLGIHKKDDLLELVQSVESELDEG